MRKYSLHAEILISKTDNEQRLIVEIAQSALSVISKICLNA